PIGKQAAAAASGNSQFFLVDITTLDEFIYASHQILVVIAGIVVLNDVSEVLTVSSTPTRVRIEHHVAFGGHPLKLVIKNESIGGVRAAMNIENQRVLLVRVKVGRLLHPGLNFFSVEARVPDFLRLSKI